MNVLPPVTEPSPAAPGRSHRPERAAYRGHRECLRWEFGFSCAFCLLHEGDLTEHGIDGTGLAWIEHRELQGAAPDRAGDYDNCFWSCRWCNRARGIRPLVDAAAGARLLDPTVDAWGSHFHAEDDRLRPMSGDADAEYTHRTYDIDHDRKRALRADRREAITGAITDLTARSPLVERLLSCADRTDDADDREMLLDAARRLRTDLRRTLLRYAAVPADAPASCGCGDAVERRLPAWLAAQTRDLPVG